MKRMLRTTKQAREKSGGIGQRYTDSILVDLLAMGALAAIASTPYLAVMTLPFAYDLRKRGVPKDHVRITFHNLKRRGFIRVESKRGQVRITLTEKGKARALKEKLTVALSEKRHGSKKRWDKRWRVLFFDIPVEQSVVRDALRHLLKKVGFVQLQQSVWLFPFDCRNEVDELKHFFELDDRACRLIVTDSIGDDRRFRKHFVLR